MNTSTCENENVCSLQDVIDSEIENNEMATAVLGASDAKNCSYDRGYVDRQALYSCATCFKETKQLNAICLACSYVCHQNHDLYELYTKRNIRCDCGNKKFSSDQICKLQPAKEDFNELNKYNHNFEGLYCTCKRPYPDPEYEENANESSDDDIGEMVQCTVCEDWFHFAHLLGNEAFEGLSDDFDEMVCHVCMEKNQFLWFYQGYIPTKIKVSENEIEKVDVVEATVEKNDKNSKNCVLAKMKTTHNSFKAPKNQACYFLNGWREALCKCESCSQLYEANEVKFLTNPEDAIKYYEEKGKQEEAKSEKIDENALLNQELSKLNHVAQIEVLHNLNNFKQELRDFLSSFAEKGEVVKRENIDAFFEDLKSRKKQKTNQNVNYYCK
jgi:E3 ubiquitin-protein ligase UBR7